ncbi:MAG TPA: hypothetical protein VMA97_08010 [Streptosporangiaceae bacterium]|nr:hypothetical protein [Streptosporangiaceae bacterium]
MYSLRSSSTSGNRRRQARSTGTQAVIVSAHAIRIRPPVPAAVGRMPRGSRSMTGVPSSRSISAI